MPIASSVRIVRLRSSLAMSVWVRSKKPAWSSGIRVGLGLEVEVLDLGAGVEREALLAGPVEVALQHERADRRRTGSPERCWMSQNIRATGASSPRHGHDLEGVRVRHGEHVGLLDPAVALDRGAVEGHALLERTLELGRGDGEALERAEHVGEPEPDEPDAALLDGAQDVFELRSIGCSSGPVQRAGAVPADAGRRLGTVYGGSPRLPPPRCRRGYTAFTLGQRDRNSRSGRLGCVGPAGRGGQARTPARSERQRRNRLQRRAAPHETIRSMPWRTRPSTSGSTAPSRRLGCGPRRRSWPTARSSRSGASTARARTRRPGQVGLRAAAGVLVSRPDPRRRQRARHVRGAAHAT